MLKVMKGYCDEKEYIEEHPIYNRLSYDAIVGIIQLMIDEGLVEPTERVGIYVEFKDFLDYVKMMYQGLKMRKSRNIALISDIGHLFKPYIYSYDKL